MSNFLDFLLKPCEQGEADINSIMDIQDMDDIDVSSNFENNDLMSSEFFDSVLSMERENLENGIDDTFLNDLNSEATFSEGSSSHVEDAFSPGGTSSDCEIFNLTTENNDITFYKSDVNDGIDENIISIVGQGRTLQNNNYTQIFQKQAKVLLNHQNTKKIFLTKPANNQIIKKGVPKPKQQVLRVQSLSGNGRSLLLPVNVKSVKIINACDLKVANMKMTPLSCHKLLKNNNSDKYSTSSSESVDDDAESESNGESRYPPLNLTSEEKRLLFKEGIQLPTHYPLTKTEEKELKRIRRKIRNKISAQDSRKRKKEYVDKLEEKAKRTTEENEFLKKRIKLLRKQNSRLTDQMKKLQAVLFNTSSTKATPTTCLMIVLFSTLLVCLPNLRTSEKTEIGEQQLVAARRALLFDPQASNEEEGVNMDDFLVFNKDEEELESFEDDVAERNTEHSFVKFLNEITQKSEVSSNDKNCSDGQLSEFCKKYEGDIKTVINNMKELLEKDTSYGTDFLNEKKFVEPDLSDNEDFMPPKKKMKYIDIGTHSKDLPVFHEYKSAVIEDVTFATVENKSFQLNSKKE